MANVLAINFGSTEKYKIQCRYWKKPGVFSPMYDIAPTVPIGQWSAVTLPDMSDAVSVMFFWEKRPALGVVVKEAALAQYSPSNPDAVLAWELSDGYHDAPSGFELVSCYATKLSATAREKPTIQTRPEKIGN